MIGLDAAGKTSILYQLKLGKFVTAIPSVGFNIETIDHKNLSLTVWDLPEGGHRFEALHRHYYANSQGVIYVVDSNDRKRIDEMKDQLNRILIDNDLRDVIVLIIANKQDLPNAMSTTELIEKLNLKQVKQKWHIQATNAMNGDGLYEGMEWLSNELAKQ